MSCIQINGLNGTLIANQYARDYPFRRSFAKRTVISSDNGAFWTGVSGAGVFSEGWMG